MLIFLALLGAALYVYWPSLKAGMVGDDGSVLVPQTWAWKNPIRLPGILINNALRRWCAPEKETRHFHLTNILFHACNGGLIWLFLSGLGLGSFAWLGALWFIVQPLAINAVANISGLSNVLGGFLSIVALIVVLHGYPLAALPLVLMAICTRQDLVLLPLMTTALLLWQGHLWALTLLLLPILLILSFRRMFLANVEAISDDYGWPPYLEGWPFIKTYFVESVARIPRWFFGFGYSLSPDCLEASNKEFGCSLFIVSLMALASWWLAPPLALLALALIGTAPWMGYFVKPMPDVILEHRAYTLLIGLTILAVLLMSQLPLWMAGLWIGLLASTARIRAAYWAPNMLWKAAVEIDGSQKPMALLNRATEYLVAGQVRDAERLTRKAMERAPHAFHAHSNLINIVIMLRQLPLAIMMARVLVRQFPRVPHAYLILANLFETVDRRDRALAILRRGRRFWVTLHGKEQPLLLKAYVTCLLKHFAPALPPTHLCVRYTCYKEEGCLQLKANGRPVPIVRCL